MFVLVLLSEKKLQSNLHENKRLKPLLKQTRTEFCLRTKLTAPFNGSIFHDFVKLISHCCNLNRCNTKYRKKSQIFFT